MFAEKGTVIYNNSNFDAMSSYFKDISKIKILSASEEAEFCHKMDSFGVEYYTHLMSISYSMDCMHRFLTEFSSNDDIEINAHRILNDLYKDSEFKKLSINSVKKFYDAIRMAEFCRQWTYELHNILINYTGEEPQIFSSSWRKNLIRKYNIFTDFKRKFVSHNLRLVISIVKHYKKHSTHLAMVDLVQEGNTGLMKAVDKFDVNRGVKFSTYAVWWIRQQVRRAMADKEKLIRLPVHLTDDLMKLARFEQLSYSQTGNFLDKSSAAEKLGMKESKLQLALQVRNNPVISLDLPIKNDEVDSPAIIEILANEDEESPYDKVYYNELKSDLESAMKKLLTDQEQKIIKWRFGMVQDEFTLQQIADKYDLSRERIRQLEARALQKLKKAGLREHVGHE